MVFLFPERDSISSRLALVMIVAIALLHRAGMPSTLGESGSCSISDACVWVCLVCWGSVRVGVSVFGLRFMFLTVFLSRVMCFSCVVPNFVMGECSLVFISLVGG